MTPEEFITFIQGPDGKRFADGVREAVLDGLKFTILDVSSGIGGKDSQLCEEQAVVKSYFLESFAIFVTYFAVQTKARSAQEKFTATLLRQEFVTILNQFTDAVVDMNPERCLKLIADAREHRKIHDQMRALMEKP